MQKYYLLCLLLLISIVVPAQNYQPFLPGKLHYFVSGTNYSVRVDTVGQIGVDSAFWMNTIAIPPTANCSINNTTHFVPDQEGLYADHFIRRANGAYQFVSRSGDTATFHTQMPIATPWQFLSDSTLTASITSRSQFSVFGQLDSLIVIDISDGNQYQLTKNFGMYIGSNLSYYLHGDAHRLSALAELPSVPDFKDFFDWQPGDVYNIHEQLQPAWDKYARYQVLQRTESLDGDSLTFQLKRNRSQNWIPSPISFYPTDTISVTYTQQAMRFLELATYEADTNANGYHWQRSWNETSTHRKILSFYYFNYPGMMDTCGYGYYGAIPPCNEPMPDAYTMGLGRTSYWYVAGQTMTTCIYVTAGMPCYEQADHDSLGPCPAGVIALGSPQPFGNLTKLKIITQTLTGEIAVEWEGMVPGRYVIQLFDLNGHLISSQEKNMGAQGSLQLVKPGSVGMYLLRISNPEGSMMQTLRVAWLTD